MSKQNYELENSLFLNNKHQIQFHKKCANCVFDCKVPYKAISVVCDKKYIKVNKNSTYKQERINKKMTEKEIAENCKVLIEDYEKEFPEKTKWYKDEKLNYKITANLIKDYEKYDDISLCYWQHKALMKVLCGKDI
jgi:hypothetical protein